MDTLKGTLPLFIIMILCCKAGAMVAYDCRTPRPNTTTISLNEVGQCNIENIEPIVDQVPIELLQETEYSETLVKMCKVKVEQEIAYCGMHSHNSRVKDGSETFIFSVNREICSELINVGQFKYGNALITDIKLNITNRRTVTAAGILKDDGSCVGAVFVNGKHEYKDVFVIAKLEIQVSEVTVPFRDNENEIILPSGTRCKYTNSRCMDSNEVQAFWSVSQKQQCNFDKYVILYEGVGVRVSDISRQTPSVYFGNSSDGIRFGLATSEDVYFCGFHLKRTEQSRLFIRENLSRTTFTTRRELTPQNILINTYFNTKISYLSRHVKTQFNTLYKDILTHRCNLERQTMLNSIHLANTDPDEFAMIIMKARGYTAYVAGEVAHLVECKEVECKIRQDNNCFHDLPATCNNESVFLKPRTHVISTYGRRKDCSNILPAMMEINGKWCQFTPQIARALPPQILQPMTKPTWKYEDLDDISNGGIYTKEELAKFQEHIIFPSNKPAILEDITRKIQGGNTYESQADYKNLLNIKDIEEMAESKFNELWKNFMQFGSASAGILMIILIFQAIAAIINISIHGYTLYNIYGWSLKLLGAILGSITNLLLYASRAKPKEDTERKPTEVIELVEQPKPQEVSAKNGPQMHRSAWASRTMPAKPHRNVHEIREELQLQASHRLREEAGALPRASE